ncbi:MAG: hypothetical protein HRU76_13755 [Phycisphaeraceae bacterium]|nr:hypothetical protein [Phycisphaerales bacterium]QOJ18584.1 MAG: hypothetical protein HRU76_13755 [Phycisphaeraceae bacterium]
MTAFPSHIDEYGEAVTPPLRTPTEYAVRAGSLLVDWIKSAQAKIKEFQDAAARDGRALSLPERSLINALGEFIIFAQRVNELQREALVKAGGGTVFPDDVDARIQQMPVILRHMPPGTYYEQLTEREQELRQLYNVVRTFLPELSAQSWTIARQVAQDWDLTAKSWTPVIDGAMSQGGILERLAGSAGLIALAVLAFFAWRALK